MDPITESRGAVGTRVAPSMDGVGAKSVTTARGANCPPTVAVTFLTESIMASTMVLSVRTARHLRIMRRLMH